MSLPTLPPRDATAHKGDFGRALLIGGSRGMSGAIALAGMAALRGGAGLVTLAVPDRCLETVAAFEPSLMTTPLPCDAHGRIAATARSAIERLAASATCLACGPGVGRSTELVALLDWMWRSLPGTIVVDADGLNNLCDTRGGLDDPAGPRIITPHPGEFGRLVDDTALTREQAVALATQLAALNGIVVVLKGHQTVTTDGREQFVNATGNPGMATGGAGDVLTGLIAALVCQGLAPLRAARLAVHLHGLAGDLAAAELGQVSLIARDLVDYLPRAFARLPAEERPG